MVDTHALVEDLRAEQEDLVALLAGVDAADWARPTPAPGWTITDQVAHLAFFDRAALTALTDTAGFERLTSEALADPGGFVEAASAPLTVLAPADLLAEWRRSSSALREALGRAPAGTRVPWFGPPMSVASKATARLMETWAHGQDVVDALGAAREPTDRLRHIVHLALRVRPYSYLARGLGAPETPVRVELTAPGGGLWRMGDDAAEDVVTGDALEFCLVLTRRRHVDDTDLGSRGTAAREWLRIGQTYAGGPGEGRRPGQFARTEGVGGGTEATEQS
ncbi:TIGR03084 family metal-binding protein [Nocardiopsis sp. MG754419]|uniref:TIGR03084 family metal-binding protein n=1 Tax=Nocardiopsis sp. MG754419 TaxID=2259865 RepID=UPI001BAD8F1D|nr:TIGR03084 family metal-binding protein [Nocardiopsis sp. MG754419]MBR8743270.1 TIGR03084 family protein [Nocardiopsis sp. MG754419]